MKQRKKLLSAISIVISFIMFISVINLPTFKVKAAGTVDEFVERCYQVVLGRGSDAGGKQYWTDRLTKEDALDGRATGGFVAYSFLVSPEFLNKPCSNEQFVESLYTMFMNRPSDADGLAYWCGRLERGEADRLGVIAGFINSEEFFKICEGAGVTAGSFPIDNPTQEQVAQMNQVNLFVDRMYEKCMGRRGDYGGQYYWLSKLLSKEITGVDCAKFFVSSPEFAAKNLNNEGYVEVLYRVFMGREYDAGGKAYWLENMSNGMTRDEVFEGFAMAPEFEGICENYGINRGTYKATDVSKPQEPEEPQNPDQPEKRFRAVKRLFSCGDYSLITYESPNATYNPTEKRFDKDGNFKGYVEVSEHNADYTEQKSGYTSFDDKGNETYKYFSKWVYSSDGMLEKEYHYSDEWNTLTGYSLYDCVKFTFTENGESYDSYLVKKETDFDPNGKMTGYILLEQDSKGRLLNQKKYDANGKLTWDLSFEYYYKKESEYEDRKKTTSISYTDGQETWRYIDEYDENGKQTKSSYYDTGKLSGYTLFEYNSKGNLTKSVNYYCYNGEEGISSWYIYEYDSRGNLVKETGYDSDSTVNSTRTCEYSNDWLIKETSWEKYNNDMTRETTYKYDQYGNNVKIARKENGVETYWEEIQYAEY